MSWVQTHIERFGERLYRNCDSNVVTFNLDTNSTLWTGRKLICWDGCVSRWLFDDSLVPYLLVLLSIKVDVKETFQPKSSNVEWKKKGTLSKF